MTSSPDSGSAAHLDPERLAEHLEGLLPPDEAAGVQAHLARCAHCAAVRDALLEVRAVLGSAPEPGPVPALVARRIDAAIAAEGRRRPVGEAVVGAAGRVAAVAPVRRRRWLPGIAAAAAAAAAVAVGIPVVTGGLGGSGDSTAESGRATDESAVDGARGGAAPELPAATDRELRSAARAAAAGSAAPSAADRASGGDCRLDRVDAVPGVVVQVRPAPDGIPAHVLVALRRGNAGTAVVLAACDPGAAVLARADSR